MREGRGAVAVAAVALMLAGCAGGESTAEPSATAPVRETAPEELHAAARVLNDTRDGPTVPWSARLAGVSTHGPRVCGADFSVQHEGAVAFRMVNVNGEWSEVFVDPQSGTVLAGPSRSGRPYQDTFGPQTPEEIVAGTWKCTFAGSGAYETVVVLNERNGAGTPVDPVARLVSSYAQHDVRDCRQTGSGIDGITYECVDRSGGGTLEAILDGNGALVQITFPNGRVLRP